MLGVFCIGIGALSFALALASKDQDWLFWTVQQTLIFPMLLLAGMLLPVEGGPGWLRFLSAAQPADLRHRGRAGAVRRRPSRPHGAAGRRAAAVVAVVGLAVGLRSMKRSS